MGRRLVCFCMDVTEKDLERAVRLGFAHPEMAKRYTTAMMGPCQGKMCALRFMQVLSRLTGQPLEELRLPTLRPPVQPVPLGVLIPPEAGPQ